MALVVDPFNSGQASGKVGSQVASRNASGAIMRRNAKPVNPKSPTQTQRRYEFTQVGNLFLSLSTARVDSWNQFGANNSVPNRLGISVFNSGINWFKALNSRLLSAGVSIILDPPLSPNPSFLPNVSIAQTGGGNVLFGSDITIPVRGAIWVNGSGNLTTSRRFRANGTRNVTIYATNTMPLNFTLTSAADLSLNDSSRQYEWFAVDEFGRSTAPVRVILFPSS